MLKVAIVGCGAVSRQCHLPAVLNSTQCRLAALVDVNDEAALRTSEDFALSRSLVKDLDDLHEIDAAIVATPPQFHSDVCLKLLSRGIHVLCEKPLANSSDEARKIVECAASSGAVLAVSSQKRFSPNSRLLKEALANREIGVIRSFALAEGFRSNWDTANVSRFDPAFVLGGVLFESGIHWLDRLRYWFGDMDVVSYQDDRLGGVEANCILSTTFDHSGGQTGTIHLSWTDPLTNSLELVGTKGKLVLDDSDTSSVLLIRKFAKTERRYYLAERPRPEPSEFLSQLEVFATTVIHGERTEALATGNDGLRVLELIEKAYGLRTELAQPWVFSGIVTRGRHE